MITLLPKLFLMFYFSIRKLFSSDIFLIRRYGSLLQPFLDVGKVLGSLQQISQLGCGVKALETYFYFSLKIQAAGWVSPWDSLFQEIQPAGGSEVQPR